MLTFVHPWLLALLVPLAAAAWWRLAVESRARSRALTYSSLAAVMPFARDVTVLSRALGALSFVAAALLIAALAAPRALIPWPLHDAAAILCIDTSGSMGADDFTPTRSAAARSAARRFIDALPDGTRLGIVAFSSTAQVVLAPTDDRVEQRSALERIPDPNGATAIGSALVTAASLLPHRGHRAIVLLTDGENNRPPDPETVAQRIGRGGIAIDTVGIGLENTTAVIPGTNELAGLDVSGLRAIASAGHGSYVQATDAGQLATAFAHLARTITWDKRRVSLENACVVAALSLLILGALGRTALMLG